MKRRFDHDDNENFIVLNKSAGISVQGGTNQKNLVIIC